MKYIDNDDGIDGDGEATTATSIMFIITTAVAAAAAPEYGN